MKKLSMSEIVKKAFKNKVSKDTALKAFKELVKNKYPEDKAKKCILNVAYKAGSPIKISDFLPRPEKKLTIPKKVEKKLRKKFRDKVKTIKKTKKKEPESILDLEDNPVKKEKKKTNSPEQKKRKSDLSDF